jgi:hypothetical protein
MNIFRWTHYTILRSAQRLCRHPVERVTADLNSGDSAMPVCWCRVCGAYRYGDSHYWNEPRPDWYRDQAP